MTGAANPSFRKELPGPGKEFRQEKKIAAAIFLAAQV